MSSPQDDTPPPTPAALTPRQQIYEGARTKLVTRTMADVASMADGALNAHRSRVEPQNIGEMAALADMLSKGSVVQIPIPRSTETRDATPQEILALILTGADMGLSAMQSVRGLFNIGGKIGAYVKMLHAMVRAHPLCKELRPIKTTRESAIWFAWREGDTQGQEFEFTIEDATAAELTSRAMWRKHLRRMLSARALGEAIQMTWPDVIQGLGNADELIEGMGGESDEPTPEVVARREEEARRWASERRTKPGATPEPGQEYKRAPEAKPKPGPTAAELHSAFLVDARKAGARTKAEMIDAAIAAVDKADLSLLTLEDRPKVLAEITRRAEAERSPEKSAAARSVLDEARAPAANTEDDDIRF